ncbi:MAG: beta-galactosidase [Lentisphaeria bacterium]|nr:beta-galactosidase [Lentisphaeria bacterium]
MKNSLLLAAVFLSGLLSAESPLPVIPARPGAALDFDFRGVGGKTEFKDRTGNYKLISDTAPMLEEEGALRISDSARLHIPCKNNAFGEKVTIIMWFLHTAANNYQWETPLLERGLQENRYRNVVPYKRKTGQYDFTLHFAADYPGFTIGRTADSNVGTEGILAHGRPYDRTRSYYNSRFPKWPLTIHNDPAKLYRKNYWQQIVATYDHGACKIYLGGKPVASVPTKRKEKFLSCGHDLVVGAYRTDSDLNKESAEIRVKSLVILPKVLNDQEVADIYAAESPLMDVQRKRENLKLTHHYYSGDRKAADPALKRTLKISKKYMEKLPEDPYKGNRNMTGRFNSNGMLEINGKLYPPVMANMYMGDQSIPRRKVIVTDFAAAGIDVQAFNVYTAWAGDYEYDWKKLDEMLEMHVKSCPTVKLNVMVRLIAPEWFKKKYPEELEMQAANFKEDNPPLKPCLKAGGLLGSEKFRKMSEKFLEAFIEHCEKGPYANHIYSYQLFAGDAGEWYWPGLFAGTSLTGYSEPTRQGLIKFLRKKYNNDVNALRKAWRNDQLTFETVKMPSPKRRLSSEHGLFRDPATAQDIYDIRCYLNARTAECFLSATSLVRRLAPKKIVGIYGGYAMLFAKGVPIMFSGLQTLSQSIRSSSIDFIATPLDYGLRRYKMPGVNINAFEASAALYNKSIWREEDIPTHLYELDLNSRSGSLRETLEVKRRAFGYTLAGRAGFWYCWQMNLPGFHQDEIMEDSAKMKKIADASVNRSRKSVAKVALIFDEYESLMYTNAAGYGRFMNACSWSFYRDMHNSGIPFDVYFPDDLANPKMPDYKMYVFLNQWAISDKLADIIRKKLARNQAMAVWQYAPGYIYNKRFDLNNMKKLTGISFTENMKQRNFAPEQIRYSKSPLAQGLSLEDSLTLSPAFSAKQEPGTEILATANGLNILARAGRSLWSLLPLTPELIRNLARSEGIHIYSNDGNTLVVNESYLMVHTRKDGPFTVSLPAERKVTECIRNRDFGTTKTIHENLPAGTTAIYLLEKTK